MSRLRISIITPSVNHGHFLRRTIDSVLEQTGDFDLDYRVLDGDDVLLPGALARVAAAFERDPGAEWVHGRCRIIDEHDQPVRRWISFYKHHRSRNHTFANLLTENYVSQMTAFWRRSVHDEIGTSTRSSISRSTTTSF